MADYGLSFDDAWYEYTSWCMRTGSRWDDSSFSQGAAWPQADDLYQPMFSYPGAVHYTDGSDGLDSVLSPLVPVLTINPVQTSLHSLGFLPVAFVGFRTTSSQFNILTVSSDSVPVAFLSVARYDFPFPPVIDHAVLGDGDTTLIPNWFYYDTLFVVASAGVHLYGSPDGIAAGETSPFLLAALDTSVTPGGADVTIELPVPNPVRFDLSEAAHIGLILSSPKIVFVDFFSLSGDHVRSIKIEDAVGSVDVVWDGRNEAGVQVAAGLYMCRVTAGTTEQVFRIGVVR